MVMANHSQSQSMGVSFYHIHVFKKCFNIDFPVDCLSQLVNNTTQLHIYVVRNKKRLKVYFYSYNGLFLIENIKIFYNGIEYLKNHYD